MQAIVLDKGRVCFNPHHAEPVPLPGETLVRVSLAGICETDLQLVRGYMGFRGIPGHEFVGMAETGPWAGRRVVGEINCACGGCRACRAGNRNHCPHRSVIGILNHDGAFAERVSVPQENLHLVPDELGDEAAVFTEPVAAAFQIPAQVALRQGLEAVVLGAGRLGNLCAQVLRVEGCQVTVIGKHPRKLNRLESLGIPSVLLEQFEPQQAAELVVDCTGSPSGLPLALRTVRPRGTVVLKTTIAGEQALSMAPLVIDEVTLVGSRCGPFDRALEALARREIDVAPLVDGVMPLAEGVGALERAGREPVLKLLLQVTPQRPQSRS
ncbi:MAG: MDR/zinc-dependent alcohol dehydrogenase-like family protein [Planctomycetaceae bacterium]